MLDSCYFCGTCKNMDCRGCKHYYPITDEATDKMIDKIIENERERFRTEWFRYVSSYNFD